MSESSSPATFTGWCRIGRGPWRKVLEADSEDRCWALLPGLAPVAQCRDLAVCPAGTDPNSRRAAPPVMAGMRTPIVRK
jgi:hypothetical protein